jgi:hypothetical protein|tara:strand:- start:2358 stop:2549 length:192 start_codon:yes stop_codon:yes gene_type:complete
MKRKITALMFATLLLTSSCGSTKPAADKCCKTKTEVVSGENDPVMKLLLSGLIILSINFLFTK